MGKYIQKQSPKSAGDVAPMDTGVLTRAKTLALQKSGSAQAGNYLQLRSRRLEKPPISARKRRQRVNRRKRGIDKNVPDSKVNSELGEIGDNGVAEDGSIGENLDRKSRESTPVSLIRDPKIIRSPRPVRSARVQKQPRIPILNPVPTEAMDAIFAKAVAKQQKEFIKKYNFDPVNEVPLPGRYEWEKVDPKA